jgi:hypothetical protein
MRKKNILYWVDQSLQGRIKSLLYQHDKPNKTNQRRTPFICTLWVPILLSFTWGHPSLVATLVHPLVKRALRMDGWDFSQHYSWTTYEQFDTVAGMVMRLRGMLFLTCWKPHVIVQIEKRHLFFIKLSTYSNIANLNCLIAFPSQWRFNLLGFHYRTITCSTDKLTLFCSHWNWDQPRAPSPIVS